MTRIGDRVAVGRTSNVYEYGVGSVIKVPRPSVPHTWAQLEARFTMAVHEIGAPAPEVRDVVRVDGRDAIVLSMVDGRSLWQHLADDGDATIHGRTLARVHCQILSVGLPCGIEGLATRMHEKIEAATFLTDEERGAAKQILQELPSGAALLHGDLHPGNVLMSDSGPVAIDWFDVAIGHPVADVVRSSLLMRDFGLDRPHLPGANPELLSAVHDAYVDEMAAFVGATPGVVAAWEAVVAASRLAERAEADESALLSLWRDRRADRPTAALVALAAT